MKFKKSERSQEESVNDKLLLLYILDKFRFTGKTKLHKAVFFAEKSSNDRKMKIFNYDFVRYNFGEYSNDLQTDYRELVQKGFIIDTKPIEVTPEGKEIMKRCKGVIDKNRFLLNNIEPIIEHIVSLPLDKIKEIAYNKVIIEGVCVGNMDLMEKVLTKLNIHDAERGFNIGENLVENLSIVFNSGIFLIDEDTRKEYEEIQEIMQPKRIKLLSKLDSYEEIC